MTKASFIEPGILPIFKTYAWLRLLMICLLPWAIFKAQSQFGYWVNLELPFYAMIGEALLIVAYLYCSWLREKLGRFYLPIALLAAAFTMLIEQYMMAVPRSLLQIYPFLYILLILVAWQYSFREVTVFALAVVMMELVLDRIFPRVDIVPLPSGHLEWMVTYGLMLTRTVSFLIVGFVVTQLMKAQRSQHRALADANLQLIQQAAMLEQLTISRERNRLSRELHDTLAHTLSSLVVQLDAVLTVWQKIPLEARQMLEQMLVSARSGLDETRRALSALRASPLDEIGLALALRSFTKDFAERHDLELDLNISNNLGPLQPSVEQCLYRVTQEALENVAKHAGAGRLWVWLTHAEQTDPHPGAWRLEIADDGQGFELREPIDEQRLGLRGMVERAELIGARLEIDSSIGKGTKITLTLENLP